MPVILGYVYWHPLYSKTNSFDPIEKGRANILESLSVYSWRTIPVDNIFGEDSPNPDNSYACSELYL